MSESDPPQPTVTGTLRAMSRTARLLILGVFINNLTAFLNAFLVLFLVHRGIPAWQAGLALAALMVGRVIGVMAGGVIAARFAYRWIIGTSMGAGAALTVALVQAPGAWLAAAIAGMIGVATRASQPTLMAWLAELTPRNQQVMVVALQRLAFNIGATVGPLLATLLIAYSYNLLFYADAATSLGFCLLSLTLLPSHGQAADPERHGGTVSAKPGGYRQALADTRFMVVTAGVFFIAMAYVQTSASLPLFILGTGHSARVYALLLSINGLVVIALEVLLSKWTQRLWAGLPMTLGMGLMALGYLLYLPSSGLALLIVATTAWTLGEVVASPSMLAYPVLVSPAGSRGQYIATTNTAQQIGSAVGPMVGIAAWQLWGSGVWVVTGAFAAVAALLVAAGAGVRRSRSQPVKPSVAAGTVINHVEQSGVTHHE